MKFTTAQSIEGEIGQAAVSRDLVGLAFYVDPLALPQQVSRNMQISVRGARVVFGSTTVFSNLSAAFPSGALTVVVGPSGSGKSTLLSALAGYTRLAAGSIALGALEEHAPSRGLVAWYPKDRTR